MLKASSSSTPESEGSFSLHPLSSSKSTPTVGNTFEFHPESEAAVSQVRDTWYKRCLKHVATRYPNSYAKCSRFVIYCRGPRPKVDLPGPKPLLDVRFEFKGRRISIPLESSLIRHTAVFTNKWIFLIFCIAYIISFAFFTRTQAFITPEASFIGCTSTYWAANDGCGLDGQLCLPFDNSSFDFRCPAQCDSVILLNPRTVGNEQVVFRPLIVGGGDSNHTYRGDTFICSAALQAGLISRSKGGCASLELVGDFTDFLPLNANGLSSIGFPSVFPLSFRFTGPSSLTHCEDLRWPALAFNVIITCLLFMILRPKPLALYWSLVCIGFWHIALFSQPQAGPPPLSTAFGTFLPVLFIAYAFWRLAFRFTLPAFSKAPIEAAVLYGGPFWAGVLTNLTTDRIPISRLTASDITKRSGGITALVIIIVIVTIIVVNQIRVIRKTGWFPYYLGWYVLGGLVALVLSQLPGLQLRLHHYILAIILMPGTAWPTRLSAIYQGLLLGMFLNGAAAFGLAPILQTGQELRQDAPFGSLLPAFLTNSTNYNTSIPFTDQVITWDTLTEGWDGFALLVDDVERYVGTNLNFSLAGLEPSIPHFFRLAFTLAGEAADFTMPGILWPNGTWSDPLPGPS